MSMTSLIIVTVGAIIIISNSKYKVTSTYGGPAVDRPDMASILAEKIQAHPLPPEFIQKRVVEKTALNLPHYSGSPFDTRPGTTKTDVHRYPAWPSTPAGSPSEAKRYTPASLTKKSFNFRNQSLMDIFAGQKKINVGANVEKALVKEKDTARTPIP
ncbi:hypothetical protein B0H14DRAFT_2613040 [Mycena olivaceomarginata]|nr:hypothetical protein B0H14DRAFT_2613040 [Mycena olivaceomarginata]